jgi:chromosome segregation ATPase
LDLSQATQLLTWLDEEHRKDKAMLMALRSQVEAQKVQLKEQAHQLQEIEALLGRFEGQFAKVPAFEESLQDVRTEFAGLLAKHATEHEVIEETRTKTQQLETEGLARIVHEVQERVEVLGSVDKIKGLIREEASSLRSELTQAVAKLSETAKRLEAQESRLDLVEQDAPLFRDGLTNARLGHEDLHEKTMALKATVENTGTALNAKIEQLQGFVERMDKRRWSELEALQVKQQEQARLVGDLEKDMKALQTPIERWTKQMKAFTEQFERSRKALYDLRELEKQVRQQGNEVLELQRLAADRMRTEVREWQDSQIRVDEEQTAHLEQLEAWQRKTVETLQSLEERIEQNRQEIDTCSDRLRQTWTEYVQTHLAFLDSVVKRRGSG